MRIERGRFETTARAAVFLNGVRRHQMRIERGRFETRCLALEGLDAGGHQMRIERGRFETSNQLDALVDLDRSRHQMRIERGRFETRRHDGECEPRQPRVTKCASNVGALKQDRASVRPGFSVTKCASNVGALKRRPTRAR